jgi:hypothetical protein
MPPARSPGSPVTGPGDSVLPLPAATVAGETAPRPSRFPHAGLLREARNALVVAVNGALDWPKRPETGACRWLARRRAGSDAGAITGGRAWGVYFGT